MNNKAKSLVRLGLVLLLGWSLAACGSNRSADEVVVAPEEPQAEDAASKECLACHTNLGVLEAKTDAARAAVVLVDPEVMGTHGKLGCLACHEGKETVAGWHPAILARPTADGGEVCGSCHGQAMVDNYKSSIHFTLSGIARGLCERLEPLRLADPDGAQAAFDSYFNSPDSPDDGCMLCHATCGTCHVNQPRIAAYLGEEEVVAIGLQDKHRFLGEPEPEASCMACHYENAEGWEANDVHAGMHMDCLDCHTNKQEFHGRDLADMPQMPLYGQGPDAITNNVIGPVEPSLDTKSLGLDDEPLMSTACQDCHNDAVRHTNADGTDLAEKVAIENHSDSLDCFSCHTQPYGNCYGCHPAEESLEMYVKLGLTVKGDATSKLGLLTHLGSDPNMIEGHPIPADNSNPKWKSEWCASSAMHQIARKPLVYAETGDAMCANCHNGTDGGTDIFLKYDEVEPEAGTTVPLDDLNWAVPADRLPSSDF